MRSTLLVLGAGFSVPMGIPGMENCLAQFRALTFGEHRWDFGAGEECEREVAEAVLEAWASSGRDVEGYGELLVDRAEADPVPLRKFTTVLIRAYELSMQRRGAGHMRVQWNDVYLPFVKNVADSGVVAVTFNYDLLLDQALLQQGYSPEYGLDGEVKEINIESQKGGKEHRVLRPNGSMNWFVCDQGTNPTCRTISIKWQRDGSDTERLPGNWGTGPERHTGHAPRLDEESILRFLVVPPGMKNRSSFVKERLRSVHDQLQLEVTRADRVYFVGWSAPPTDRVWAAGMFSGVKSSAVVHVVNFASRNKLETGYLAILPSAVRVDWHTEEEGDMGCWKSSRWASELFS